MAIGFFRGSQTATPNQPSSNTLRSPTEPTARADGSALQTGDLWEEIDGTNFVIATWQYKVGEGWLTAQALTNVSREAS